MYVHLPIALAVLPQVNLNDKPIYAGCCFLSIKRSNEGTLSVMYNNDSSYDFTRPLPSAPGAPVPRA